MNNLLCSTHNFLRHARCVLSSTFKRRVKNKAEYFLPDEIIIDILSRLPAQDVVRCRRVCKRWRDLTSAQDFWYLHTQRSVPMVLVEDYSKFGRRDYILNKWWEPKRKKIVVHQFDHQYFTKLCHGGLIVSKKYQYPERSQEYTVFNPMNGESVRITLSEEICRSDMYGVFYHPSVKEYCTLWIIRKMFESMDMARVEVQYKMLNLGSDPQWREIRNPWSHRPTTYHNPPVLLDKNLYWLVEATDNYKYYQNIPLGKEITQIMEFDIGKEEFTLVPCPFSIAVGKYEFNTRLFKNNGLLSLVQISGSRKQIEVNIWTLKDCAKPFWLHSHYTTASTEVYPKNDPTLGMLEPIGVVNEELAFQSHTRLFVYSFRSGTIRKIGEMHMKYTFGSCAWFLSHSMSSLRNCTSYICMDENGMVAEEEMKSIDSTSSASKTSDRSW